MITRAQAEALLQLAEALEACERQSVKLVTYNDGMLYAQHPETCDEIACIGAVNGMAVRLAVNALVPKHTGS